ncbi:MAG: TetR/AcrR family transcriptional regulator [Gammaproteobacteria bacterium]|nr:TetR/AcrR family transcriptional regulator [Gammaproteobacteria bacterium]
MTTSSRPRGRPRDPVAQAQREDDLLEAATKVFAEHGFRQTDVQWIADALGVGKGTVYRCFPSKEALFLGAVDRGMRQLTAAVGDGIEKVRDPIEIIAVCVRRYLAFFDAHPEVLELLIQERAEFKDRPKPMFFVHRDANIDPWRTLLADLMRDGRVRHMKVDAVLDVLSQTLYGTIFTDHFHQRRRSFQSRADEILDVVFHGILTEPYS